MSLSQNIKRYRKVHGISQEYVSDLLAMDQSAYSRLEAKENICAERLERIASALGTTPEVLRTYNNNEDNSVTTPVNGESTSEVMLLSKDEIIKLQTEEIMFLRQQVSYQQSVWYQFCQFMNPSRHRLKTNAKFLRKIA